MGILSKHDILYLTRIIQRNDGFVAITSSDYELNNIFNYNTDSKLRANEFFPQNPPQLKAIRSVLLTRIDKHISNKEENEILIEIEEKNY